jgi:GT2 family glycosyltransferase
MAATDAPELSVVVALISGRTSDLERCLAALAAQTGVTDVELLVPYDAPCAGSLALKAKFPSVKFLELVGVDTSAARAGGSREHHDTLRTLGLRAARGRAVVLTEDHAHADPGWCAGLLAALASHPKAGCVGGAVECAGLGLLAHAVYLCDFGRYQNPLPEAPAWFVSDSNVCYRRDALDAVAETWKNDAEYHETIVHGALAKKGFELWLTPRVVVWQTRSGLTLGQALKERVVWGRSFAGSRVAGAGLGARLVQAAKTPLLPFVLTLRLLRGALAKRRDVGRTLLATPLLLLLSAFWSFGEFVGYVTGRPR